LDTMFALGKSVIWLSCFRLSFRQSKGEIDVILESTMIGSLAQSRVIFASIVDPPLLVIKVVHNKESDGDSHCLDIGVSFLTIVWPLLAGLSFDAYHVLFPIVSYHSNVPSELPI